MWRALFVAALLLLAFAVDVLSDPSPPEILYDLFSAETANSSPFNVHRLDPTGQHIAWLDRGNHLLVFEIDSGEAHAIPLHELMRRVTDFIWSPDGKQIVMAGNVFLYFSEPDVWVLKLESGCISNCTNDLVFGDIFDDSDDFWIDLFPTWLNGESIAFLRPAGDDPFGPAQLRTVDPRTCGPIKERANPDSSELAWPLPEAFPSALHVFRAPAWSPNGERVAFITQDASFTESSNGIWILDAFTGEMQWFLPTSAFAVGFPAGYDTARIVPQDIAWSRGGNVVLAFVEDMSLDAAWPRMNLFLIDVATGSITPIAQYGDEWDRLSFFKQGEDGHTGTFEVPLQAAVRPDGNGFVTLHQEADQDHADAAIVELRTYRIEDGHAVLVGISTLTLSPRARGRGPNIVRISPEGTALLLNRYVVRFDLDAF